jgi:dienelactone hydrolase
MLTRPLLTGFLFLVLLALIPGGCTLSNATGFAMAQRDIPQQVAMIAPHAELHLPETGEGPHGAVVFLHGCGGVRALHAQYAAAALEAGYAVLIVDSLGPRGIGRPGALSQVCTGLRLWGRERSADVYAAIEMLRQDARIDEDRIALAGWSHGAWTIMEALADTAAGRRPLALAEEAGQSLDGVRAAILIYPYCSFPIHAEGGELVAGVPIDAVMAGEDAIAPIGACRELFSAARTAGAEIDWQVWDGQTHAFDEPREGGMDPRVRYDEGAAERAHRYLVDRLQARM